jgi:hypothetical protein
VPIIRKLAAENGGWVNFDVSITVGSRSMTWAIPRLIGRAGWLADEQTPATRKQEPITFKPL